MPTSDILNQLARALSELKGVLPPTHWDTAAYRFDGSSLTNLRPTSSQTLDQLQGIDRQKNALIANTRQFLAGLPCNHALLTGARGNGKSSLIAAVLEHFKDQGLRLIEVAPVHLSELSKLLELIKDRPEKFVVFCDDLSFKSDDENTRALKSRLEGALDAPDGQVLIYATSNRRHLLPQHMQDNLQTLDATVAGEINAQEPLDERLSLAERFGLWLAFHPMDQALYLQIVEARFKEAGFKLDDPTRTLATRFATQRGNRSGRIAAQFCREWIGRALLDA